MKSQMKKTPIERGISYVGANEGSYGYLSGEMREEYDALRAKREELRKALGECLGVLQYIGSGVSAHGMAKQYFGLFHPLLSEEELREARARIKQRYDHAMKEFINSTSDEP